MSDEHDDATEVSVESSDDEGAKPSTAYSLISRRPSDIGEPPPADGSQPTETNANGSVPIAVLETSEEINMADLVADDDDDDEPQVPEPQEQTGDVVNGLEQVREIICGSLERDHGKRITSLERVAEDARSTTGRVTLLEQQAKELRADTDRISVLEQAINSFEAWDERITSLEHIANETSASCVQASTRIESLDSGLMGQASSLRNLEETLTDKVKELTEEMAAFREEMKSAIEDLRARHQSLSDYVHKELTTKVGESMDQAQTSMEQLPQMFVEMADRLRTGTSNLPQPAEEAEPKKPIPPPGSNTVPPLTSNEPSWGGLLDVPGQMPENLKTTEDVKKGK